MGSISLVIDASTAKVLVLFVVNITDELGGGIHSNSQEAEIAQIAD